MRVSMDLNANNKGQNIDLSTSQDKGSCDLKAKMDLGAMSALNSTFLSVVSLWNGGEKVTDEAARPAEVEAAADRE